MDCAQWVGCSGWSCGRWWQLQVSFAEFWGHAEQMQSDFLHRGAQNSKRSTQEKYGARPAILGILSG
jgi:hypothetical protein